MKISNGMALSGPGARRWGIVACVLLACWQWAVAASEGEAAPAVQTVSTGQVHMQEFEESLSLSGRWVPRNKVSVVSPLEGVRLTSVLVDVGDPVERGEIMATLDSAQMTARLQQVKQEIVRARAEASDADARKREALSAYRRAERLAQSGAISRQDHEEQRTRYLSSREAWRGAVAAIGVARAQLRELETRFSDTAIRAPVSGVVADRLAVQGEMVSMQRTLFTLIGGNELEFSGKVAQESLVRLAPGMSARLSVRGQTQELVGRVRVVGRSISQEDGYGEVKILSDGVSTPAVSEGSTGRAVVSLGSRRLLAVDVRALRYGNERGEAVEGGGIAYVMVVRKDGRVRRVRIQPGIRVGGWVEVRDGLAEGETVVLAAAAVLRDGDRVEGVGEGAVDPMSRREVEP